MMRAARILSRLVKSKFTIQANQAELVIGWSEDDGSEDAVFCFSDEAIEFRKVGDVWRLDVGMVTGLEDASEFLAAGSWGAAFRDGMLLLNEAVSKMEAGELTTRDGVSSFLDFRMAELERTWAADHRDPVTPEKP